MLQTVVVMMVAVAMHVFGLFVVFLVVVFCCHCAAAMMQRPFPKKQKNETSVMPESKAAPRCAGSSFTADCNVHELYRGLTRPVCTPWPWALKLQSQLTAAGRRGGAHRSASCSFFPGSLAAQIGTLAAKLAARATAPT